MQSRNVTFSDTSPYSMPTVGIDYSTTNNHYEIDVMDLT